MPKNKGKGGKNRKRGKNEADDDKRELVFKEDGQEYAQVTRMLGNGRCEAICVDGTRRLCHIRGKMHKKVWIAAGDIVLVGLRDYQDDKADFILKYMNDEARLLKAYGELPDTLRLNEGVDVDGPEEGEEGSDYIQFRTRTSTRSKKSVPAYGYLYCYVTCSSASACGYLYCYVTCTGMLWYGLAWVIL
uniref:Eukaryotic translation initiation factor 4C n=1 Tax=Zea mays TaxID=4577 RepID=B6T9H2_MAIZE|nr:eukaryotic translation initiation factor 1A [Zea mays]